MKKLIFLFAITFFSVSVMAQNNANKGKGKEKTEKSKPGKGNGKGSLTPEERATKITERLKTELSLTEEQTPKVKQATLNRINQVTAAKGKAGEDKKAFGQERKTIFQSWETEMKGILTEDQYKTYLAKKEEKKKKMQENKEKAKKEGKKIENSEEELEEVGE